MTPRQLLMQETVRRYNKNAREAILHNTGIKRNNSFAEYFLKFWSMDNDRLENCIDGILANRPDDDPMLKYWVGMSLVAYKRFCSDTRAAIHESLDNLLVAYRYMFTLKPDELKVVATLAANPDSRFCSMDGMYIAKIDGDPRRIIDPQRVKISGRACRDLNQKGILTDYWQLAPDYDAAAIMAFNAIIPFFPRLDRSKFY